MIHSLLRISKPLFVIDTESTGLDVQTARIVEIAFQQFNQGELVKEWCSRLNPGISIPPEATKIHGITDADVAERPMFKQIAPSLAKGWSDCAFAGKNVRYDLRLIAAEMQRASVAWSYADSFIIDADRLEQIGEPRTLSHLYEKHLHKPLEHAHSALDDVRATSEVIEAQLRRYYEYLPRSLEALHTLQWPGMIDTEGKFRFVNGVACCTFGKYRGKPMKEIPIEYYDWLIKAEFSADVKALASAAKLGRFPEMKDDAKI